MEYKLSDFITRPALAEQLGLGLTSIMELIEKGLPRVLISGIERFHVPTVCKWLMNKQVVIVQKDAKPKKEGMK